MIARRPYLALAWGSGALLMTTAVLLSWATFDTDLLSRIPPATAADPAPAADVAPGAEWPLYLSATTAWAALLLLIPAYVAVWQRRRSARARAIWRAFWSVAFLAYMVHLLVSMGLFFQWDFAGMTSSSRVSAFWPGMAIAVWWPVDLWLLRFEDAGWITAQRVALHVVTFVLFVGGSLVKGELPVVKVMGAALLIAALIGLGRRLLLRGHHA